MTILTPIIRQRDFSCGLESTVPSRKSKMFVKHLQLLKSSSLIEATFINLSTLSTSMNFSWSNFQTDQFSFIPIVVVFTVVMLECFSKLH